MIIISNFRFNVWYFCVIIYLFLTKLLTSGILLSTAVNAELVAKPPILGVLLSISVILVLIFVFVTSPLVSGVSLSLSLIFFSKYD